MLQVQESALHTAKKTSMITAWYYDLYTLHCQCILLSTSDHWQLRCIVYQFSKQHGFTGLF